MAEEQKGERAMTTTCAEGKLYEVTCKLQALCALLYRDKDETLEFGSTEEIFGLYYLLQDLAREVREVWDAFPLEEPVKVKAAAG